MTTGVEHRKTPVAPRTAKFGAAPAPAAPRGFRQRPGLRLYALGRLARQTRSGLSEARLALVRYATNHVIAHIPSYTVRHACHHRRGCAGAGDQAATAGESHVLS
jgi:hypothetical protein